MSETKTPKKESVKAPKAEKKEAKSKSDSAEKSTEGITDAKTDAKVDAKTDTASSTNKSASQSSISHFSSVTTKEYRSGWESIFGNKKAVKKTQSSNKDAVNLPTSFELDDEDINEELRALLYKAFQRKARKDGTSLAKLKKTGIIEYRLECEVSEK